MLSLLRVAKQEVATLFLRKKKHALVCRTLHHTDKTQFLQIYEMLGLFIYYVGIDIFEIHGVTFVFFIYLFLIS